LEDAGPGDGSNWEDVGTNGVKLADGATAAFLDVFNTDDGAGNSESARLGFASNVLEIGTKKAGTGTARNVNILVEGGTLQIGTAADPDALASISNASGANTALRIGKSPATQGIGSLMIGTGSGVTACSQTGGMALGNNVTSNAAYALAAMFYATTNGKAQSNAIGINAVSATPNSMAFVGDYADFGNIFNGLACRSVITTNATETKLTCFGSFTNILDIPANSSFAFFAILTARRTDADNETAAWKIEGCIDNNTGTTALVGSSVTAIADDSGGTWVVDPAANDTNDSLEIAVTGEASKTIKWALSLWYVGQKE
jgi:hypothetical protein